MASIGLLEYAEQNPAQEPPQERQAAAVAARTYRERQEAQEQAEALKESIAQQLEQGNAPQYILYTAIKAIGLLTNDLEWTEEQQRRLDTVYADLAQQSFIIDNAAIAAERLDKMQQEYIDKMRRQLTKSLNGYRRIEKALTEALQAVNEAETAKEPGILEE
jgi:uncharacterized protein YllA (UPF0747 family)